MAAIAAGAGRWEVVKKGRRPGAGGGGRGGGRGGGADRRTLGEANGVWKYDLTREYPPGPPPPGPELAAPGATEQPTPPAPGSSGRQPPRRSATSGSASAPLALCPEPRPSDSARKVAVLASQTSALSPGVLDACQRGQAFGSGRQAHRTHRPQPGLPGRVSESWEEACSFIM